ncbi:MAG: hypothetical protein R3E95_01640 [Thiolinea sp.]
MAIYQANFGDGGSEIQMKLRPFLSKYATQDMTGQVFEDYNLTSNDRKFRLELDNFRLFNINPITNAEGEVDQKNLGPSFIFKLRNEAGRPLNTPITWHR